MSQPAWLDEPKAAGRERFEPLPEMPCAGAANTWRNLYRQRAARSPVTAGRVLERRMPHGGARFECASEDAVLRGDV